MTLSRNAIGNLINRYKAVLGKCRLLNTFGSLAVAVALTLGSAGVAWGADITNQEEWKEATAKADERELNIKAPYVTIDENTNIAAPQAQIGISEGASLILNGKVSGEGVISWIEGTSDDKVASLWLNQGSSLTSNTTLRSYSYLSVGGTHRGDVLIKGTEDVAVWTVGGAIEGGLMVDGVATLQNEGGPLVITSALVVKSGASLATRWVGLYLGQTFPLANQDNGVLAASLYNAGQIILRDDSDLTGGPLTALPGSQLSVEATLSADSRAIVTGKQFGELLNGTIFLRGEDIHRAILEVRLNNGDLVVDTGAFRNGSEPPAPQDGNVFLDRSDVAVRGGLHLRGDSISFDKNSSVRAEAITLELSPGNVDKTFSIGGGKLVATGKGEAEGVIRIVDGSQRGVSGTIVLNGGYLQLGDTSEGGETPTRKRVIDGSLVLGGNKETTIEVVEGSWSVDGDVKIDNSDALINFNNPNANLMTLELRQNLEMIDGRLDVGGKLQVGEDVSIKGGNIDINGGGELHADSLYVTDGLLKIGGDVTIDNEISVEGQQTIVIENGGNLTIQKGDTDYLVDNIMEDALRAEQGGSITLNGVQGTLEIDDLKRLQKIFGAGTSDTGLLKLGNATLKSLQGLIEQGFIAYSKLEEFVGNIDINISISETITTIIKGLNGATGQHNALTGAWKGVILDERITGNSKLVVDRSLTLGGDIDATTHLVSRYDGSRHVAADVEIQSSQTLTLGNTTDTGAITGGVVKDITMHDDSVLNIDGPVTTGRIDASINTTVNTTINVLKQLIAYSIGMAHRVETLNVRGKLETTIGGIHTNNLNIYSGIVDVANGLETTELLLESGGSVTVQRGDIVVHNRVLSGSGFLHAINGSILLEKGAGSTELDLYARNTTHTGTVRIDSTTGSTSATTFNSVEADIFEVTTNNITAGTVIADTITMQTNSSLNVRNELHGRIEGSSTVTGSYSGDVTVGSQSSTTATHVSLSGSSSLDNLTVWNARADRQQESTLGERVTASGDITLGNSMLNANFLVSRTLNIIERTYLISRDITASDVHIRNQSTLFTESLNTRVSGTVGTIVVDGGSLLRITSTTDNSFSAHLAVGNSTDTEISWAAIRNPGRDDSATRRMQLDVNSSITVNVNGAVALGTSDIRPAIDAMQRSGTNAGLYLERPMFVPNGSGIGVGTGAIANSVEFASSSVLAINASTAVSGTAYLALDSNVRVDVRNASLVVMNATYGQNITVLDSTMATTDDFGNGANVHTDNALLVGRYSDGRVSISSIPAGRVMPNLSGKLQGLLDEGIISGQIGRSRFLTNALRVALTNPDDAAKAIESAARTAALAAVPQMTLHANMAALSAITQRTSLAMPSSSLRVMNAQGEVHGNGHGLNSGDDMGMAAGNDYARDGLGMWIMPMWQMANGFGLKSGDQKVDYNGSLGGVALGVDYTVAEAFRAGIAFNIGGGYASSSGDLNKTTNNMNFWGVGAYVGMVADELGLTADVNYTSSFNDIRQELPSSFGMGNLSGEVRSSAISAGLRAEYKFETEALDIIPHVAARYTALHSDDFSMKSGGQSVMKTKATDQNIWSFPVGVTFAKNIDTGNGWYVRPSLDLTVTPTTGDVDNRQKIQFTGLANKATMETQVMDRVTYGGQAGLEFGNDAIQLGLNYNLQVGEHTTNHGVFGTFRYNF